MRKAIIFGVLYAVFAGWAYSQPIQTVTVAQNQSLSPIINLAGGQVQLKTPNVGLVIFPPAALEATSYELVLYACADPAGSNCKAMNDANGNLIKFVIVGGATPTQAIQVDPPIVAGLWWFKLLIAASNDSAVSQTTASRTFTISVRSL